MTDAISPVQPCYVTDLIEFYAGFPIKQNFDRLQVLSILSIHTTSMADDAKPLTPREIQTLHRKDFDKSLSLPKIEKALAQLLKNDIVVALIGTKYTEYSLPAIAAPPPPLMFALRRSDGCSSLYRFEWTAKGLVTAAKLAGHKTMQALSRRTVKLFNLSR